MVSVVDFKNGIFTNDNIYENKMDDCIGKDREYINNTDEHFEIKMNKIRGKGNNKENENSYERSAYSMDENKILENYFKRTDDERRAQEERLSKNMELLEKRITEERIRSEERVEKLFNRTMESIKNTDNKIDSLREKTEEKMDLLSKKIDERNDALTTKIDSTNKWIVGTCLATIIGIATMVITVLVSK